MSQDYNQKYTCPHCQGTVFRIIGFYYDGTISKAYLQCCNYECQKKPGLGTMDIDTFSVEVIEKGSQCPKCKQYTLSREWKKNTRGYEKKCLNPACQFKDFDPE